MDELRTAIENRTARIVVIGQGYVGLPLSMAFSAKGFPVVGLEADPEKVHSLNAGSSFIPDIPSAELQAAIPWLVGEGFPAEWLDGDSARRLDPRLATDLLGALHVTGSAMLESYRYTLSLAQAAEQAVVAGAAH